MAALITKITTFFSGVMTMITGGTIGSGESAVTVTGLTDTTCRFRSAGAGCYRRASGRYLCGSAVPPVPSARVRKKSRGERMLPRDFFYPWRFL